MRIDGSTDASTPLKATIKDAITAVTAEDGSTVRVYDVNFINNWVGIRTPENYPSQNEIALNVNKATFVVEQLKLGVDVSDHGHAGLQLYDLSSAVFIGENRYINLDFGIEGLRSSIITLSDFFDNVAEGIYVIGSGHSLYQYGKGKNAGNPTFNTCFSGIFATNMFVHAEKNAMLGMGYGVRLRNGILKNFDVKNNIIEASHFGATINSYRPTGAGKVQLNDITVDGFAGEGAGIRSELNRNCSYEKNKLTLHETANGIFLLNDQRTTVQNDTISQEEVHSFRGIQMVGGSNNALICNQIKGTGLGDEQWAIDIGESKNSTIGCNALDSTRYGIRFIGMNMGTDLKGNRFNHHHFGLQAGADLPDTLNLTAILFPVFPFRGNRWEEAFPGSAFGAIHFGAQQDVDNSRIVVDTTDGSVYNTEDDPADFVIHDDGNTYQCISEYAGCPPSNFQGEEEITTPMLKVARNQLTVGMFEDAQVWTAKRQLYRRLLESPGLASQSAHLENFYDAEETSTVGKFELLRQDIEAILTTDSATLVELNRNYDTILVKAEALRIVDSLLHEDPSTPDSLEMEEEKVALLEVVDSVNQANLVIEEDLVEARQDSADVLYLVNENIEDEEVYETNQKIANRALLKMLRFSWSEPDSVSLVALDSVANQCPFAGGEGVYLARALLPDTLSYDDETLCNDAAQLVAKPKKLRTQLLSFRLYPNPSNGYTFIELEREAAENGEAIVFNALGKQVFYQPFSEGASTILLDFSNQPGGFYYLTLRTKSGSSSKIFCHLK